MRYLLTLMIATLAIGCTTGGCSTTRPDPTDLVGTNNESATRQTMAKFVPGTAIAEDGNATANPSSIGVDLQNGVTAAANPVPS